MLLEGYPVAGGGIECHQLEPRVHPQQRASARRDDDAEGDTYFPDYAEFANVVDEEAHPEHSPSFTYRTLTR